MTFIKLCSRIIEYSFYGLFLLVPLAFTSATSELFEMNKMWLTWALTIIIAMAWITKMVLQRKFFIQRTPLDIPILLFLTSQIISTIFSLDSHVSLWGYYSRFNGGLLSMLSYVFLYYAFVTLVSEGVAKEEGLPTARNDREHWREGLLLTGPLFVKRLLFISLISGLIVALWGLPSHFGYDPTCLLFRGTLDVSCWTADFMPKIRIFSTLGQPDWLAAYLAILLPISIAFFINNLKSNPPATDKKYQVLGIKYYVSRKSFILNTLYLILTTLFYVDLLFTRARSGILAVWISLIVFFAAYFWIERKKLKPLILNHSSLIIIGILLLITFVIGTPINQVHMLTLDGVKSAFQKMQPQKNQSDKKAAAQENPPPIHEPGGTESGHIRLLVWEGALSAWKSNPLFGTGVETFAFAYYKYKPAAHNLTSEWNFLYNKAHNEYLNYLATTGIVGLGSYLLMIGYFLFLAFKKISKSEFLISNQIPNSKSHLGQLEIRSIRNLSLALLAGYLSILITNFFGFSVVITNIYLFMIPAFVFVLMDIIKSPNIPNKFSTQTSIWQWTPIFFVLTIGFFMLFSLFRFWRADIAFALGYNLDRAGEYQNAYPHLHKAVQLRGGEPVFKDELSINDSIIAASLISQPQNEKLDQATKDKTQTIASTLVQEAINISNEVVAKHPNNAVFWKTRVRLFFTLAQVDSRYLPRAMDSIAKAAAIAPQDANILYNLGILYGQNNNIKKGIEVLEKTVKLKPNYRDAYYALGLFYRQEAIDKDGNVVDDALNKKAIAQMQYILLHISPKDAGALESIANWAK